MSFIILFLAFHLEAITYKPHVWPELEYGNESDWEDSFFFIQMADCQLGCFDNNTSWQKEISLLDAAVVHINRLRPRFVILCGDMVHAFPGTPMRAAETAAYKKVVSKIDRTIPLICLCGNHDVGNTPIPWSILRFEAEFNAPHYFSFWVGGVQGIVLNSSLISDPSQAGPLYIEQLNWFKQQLAVRVNGHPPVHRLVFSHHPWFLKSATEADNYYVIPKARRIPFLDMMKQSGVTAAFCGHYHRNSYGTYQGMPVITTSAIGRPLGSDPSGFRIVKVYHNRIEHAYYGLSKVPTRVAL
ncbi:MAG: metallophosphoesterase [Simkaniaceae bacterium]|nr:metallophosphoesterase [Simkaniaceae bacterium]